MSISFDGIPVPLEDADFKTLGGGAPDYDMVGRGIYMALRSNPDCANNRIYAGWLRDAYPHYLAELASMILQLDHKDVEVSYLDRKINYLKVMALLEPDHHRFPAEIGATFLDRGLRMSALHQSTISLYRAETFLKRAYLLSPADKVVRSQLGEVSYLLGKYDQAADLWDGLITELEPVERQLLEKRRQNLKDERIPRIPPVDYLEAIAVAFDCFQKEEFEECGAILRDVLDDIVFSEEFPMPEVWYHLGLCYQNLAMPKDAEKCVQEALKHNPGYVINAEHGGMM